jgi:uncharacterized membrane protein YfcA
MWRGIPVHQAIGSAAACGIPIAWAGALGFIIAGWDEVVPGTNLGYVNLLGFVCIALTSVASAPLGARLAHWLPPSTLRRGFAVFLVAIGLKMLAG